MGLDAAGHHAAAMKEDEAGQGALAFADRRIKAIAELAGPPRQGAVGRRDIGGLGAGKLHELGQRQAPLDRGRPRARSGRGCGHHGQKSLGNRVERHGGSG
jgi:hypothetical protein